MHGEIPIFIFVIVLLLLFVWAATRRQKYQFVVNLSIGGISVMNPVTMTDIQTLSLAIGATDADGNPTALQSPIAATLSDPAFGTRSDPVVNADGTQTITFKPAAVAGELGAVVINLASQSPDPAISGSVSVTVTASAAAQFSVQPTVA